jgi:CcmD family protein
MQQPADTTALFHQEGVHTAYDTVWAGSAMPVQNPDPLERVMLAEDKIFVVLAVVLVIWFGLLAFLFYNDRRLARIERALDERLPGMPGTEAL